MAGGGGDKINKPVEYAMNLVFLTKHRRDATFPKKRRERNSPLIKAQRKEDYDIKASYPSEKETSVSRTALSEWKSCERTVWTAEGLGDGTQHGCGVVNEAQISRNHVYIKSNVAELPLV